MRKKIRYKKLIGITEEELHRQFPWIATAEIENAVIGACHGTLHWKDGIWENGTWKNGIWMNGNWMDGIWEYGIWENGTWENGIWKNGTWLAVENHPHNRQTLSAFD